MAEEVVQAIPEVTDDDKLWALLGWIIWPIALVALLMEDKRQRPFIKYNAVQSLALTVVGWALSFILSFVIVGCFVGLAWLIYAIVLGVQSYQGKWVTIPLLTDFCENRGWI